MAESTNHPQPQPQALTIEARLQIDPLCADFDRAWRRDVSPPRIEDFLSRVEDPQRPALFAELLKVELEYRSQREQVVAQAEYLERFPHYRDIIAASFDQRDGEQTVGSSPEFGGNTSVSASPVTVSLQAASQAERLVELIHRYRQEVESGRQISPANWAAQHPEFAAPLRRALEGLERLRQTASQSADALTPQLGEFRIVREIGRGGMGAVFEAEQKSLGRLVALKVLWFGAASDEEAIRRFQREAETVARLHHTNIVPIFSVGSEGPVNYYAMQLIDGHGLDAVAKQQRGPIALQTVVEWGLQAADALAHAHQRGVVHRDVKPSNLLLDQEGQIWLTDFGLAKRRDDVTLSMAGALLGTPRYMSPEQASASTQTVDHRTDIYSLGATLYELVTGQPVFRGKTPHGVISQILTTEPTSPKRLRSEIPRDLDTVLMKCLQKEPGKRYESAKDLADDLRAILESRPIKARRTGPIELAQKWLTRHRRSVSWTAGSVAATLCCVLVLAVWWQFFLHSRAAFVTLKTDDGPLVAEIFDWQLRPVSRPETIPMRDPVSLQPGDYEVRVSGPGLLSQTYRTSFEATGNYEFDVALSDQLLTPPIENRFGFALPRRGDRCDIISYDANNLTIKILGDVEFTTPWTLFMDPQQSPGFIWPPSRIIHESRFDKFELRPWILQQTVDLNRDGSHDFIIAFRHQACVAAVSDKVGLLWFAGRGQDSIQPVSQTVAPQRPGIRSAVVQTPQFVDDINDDGIADLLVNLVDIGNEPIDFYREFVKEDQVRRWIEVVSGADGKTIWRQDVPADMFHLPRNTEIPYAFRWFTGPTSGSTAGAGGFMSGSRHLTRRYDTSHVERVGQHIAVPFVASLTGFAENAIVLLAGSHVQRIDLRSGAVTAAIDTGISVAAAPQLHDFDGDDRDDLLLLEQLPPRPNPIPGRNVSEIPRVKVIAWSLQKNETLWSRLVEARLPRRRFWWEELPAWPQIVDLDANGRVEVLLPNGISDTVAKWSRYPWGGIEAVDGATGQPIWGRRVNSCDYAADRFVVGPDVNGDGSQEVFVASFWGNLDEVVVDCVSGKDSRPLWIQKYSLAKSQSGGSEHVLSPSIWWSGEDGWPQLIVPVAAANASDEAGVTLLFSTKDGRVTHVASGVQRIWAQDVDGDRIDDLCLNTHYQPRDRSMDVGARLAIVRGVAAEPIRRLGTELRPGTDFNGDGWQDCIQVDGQRRRAFSAHDGRLLWEATDDLKLINYHVFSWENQDVGNQDASQWDFDHDSTRDILVYADDSGGRAPLQAISGRTGRVLWNAELQVRNDQGKPRIEVHDLNADGAAEIVYYGYSDWNADRNGGWSSDQGRLWLAVFSSRDGSLQWRSSLSELYGSAFNSQGLVYQFPREGHLEIVVADANGDRVQDIFVVAEPDPAPEDRRQLELRVCDGRDGSLLWRRPLNSGRDGQNTLFNRAATYACADIDLDGQPEFLLLELEDIAAAAQQPPQTTGRQALLHALDVRTGEPVWTHRMDVDAEFLRHEDNRPFFPRPSVLHGDDQAVRVALHLRTSGSTHRVVLIDGSGALVGEYTFTVKSFSPDFSMIVHDCDRDGNEDVLVAADNRVRAVRGFGKIESFVEYPIAADDPSRLKMQVSHSTEQPVLVASDLAKGEVTGFAMASGARIWHCTGPGRPQGVSPETSTIPLAAASGKAPRVLFNGSDHAICRTVAWSDARKSLTSFTGDQLRGGRVDRPRGQDLPKDPRLVRHLPWSDILGQPLLNELIQFAFHAIVCSLTLLIIPAAYLRRLVHYRRWNSRTLFVLPVLAAVALIVLTMRWELPNESTGPLERLMLAVGAAAPILFALKLSGWVASRRWRLGFAWLIVILLASVVAAVMLPSDFRGWGQPSLYEAPLEPGEYLSPHGWYMPLLPGFYWASWLFVMAMILHRGVVKLRRILPVRVK